MAIEPNRIVLTSAKREGVVGAIKPTPLCSLIIGAVSPSGYGAPGESFPQPAEYEGQTRIVETSSGTEYNMYVVVDLGGVLQWKAVKSSSAAIDQRTGRPYDANAVFYNPLAN